MTHGGPSWSNSAPRYLVFPEAGGSAALTAFSLLKPTLQGVQLIAIDRDPAVLSMWRSLGALGVTEASAPELLTQLDGTFDVVPCDEYFRARNPHLPCSKSTGDLSKAHDKLWAYRTLTGAGLASVHLPALLPRAVIRPRHGAGSKGLTLSDASHVVTAYVEHVAEYVVDVDTHAGVTAPRQTHALKNGADTFVTLIGAAHPRYPALRLAAWDVMRALGLKGIGNVQLLEDAEGRLWFVEASARLSGSAWVNTHVGLNLLTGEDARHRFDALPLHVHAGGITPLTKAA